MGEILWFLLVVVPVWLIVSKIWIWGSQIVLMLYSLLVNAIIFLYLAVALAVYDFIKNILNN